MFIFGVDEPRRLVLTNTVWVVERLWVSASNGRPVCNGQMHPWVVFICTALSMPSFISNRLLAVIGVNVILNKSVSSSFRFEQEIHWMLYDVVEEVGAVVEAQTIVKGAEEQKMGGCLH